MSGRHRAEDDDLAKKRDERDENDRKVEERRQGKNTARDNAALNDPKNQASP